jgi:hypothetical protein
LSLASLDHLVVTASSLESGAAYVESVLGVVLQPGGEHPRMGTHNRLLRLGAQTYLEVIAANPAAAPPGRPRWFDLDRLDAHSPPRLSSWVARTDDIQAASAAAGIDPATIEPMTRGSLAWQITIPPDGRPPMHGCAPALIQWSSRPHPAERLPDCGCALLRLEVYHPQAEDIRRLLDQIGFAGPLDLHPLRPDKQPYLRAIIQTPGGLRRLGNNQIHPISDGKGN